MVLFGVPGYRVGDISMSHALGNWDKSGPASYGIMHVGNAQGRSDFRGLIRINSTTDAINSSLSASGGVIVER